MSSQTHLATLRALEADISELERIKNLYDRFNIFETIGFVTQEVMHSRFLASLLDPRQNHGFEDLFLKVLLQEIPEFDSSANARNLAETTVQTEVHTGDGRIDILLLNEVGRWALIIENKIWSTEHSDQLDRYYRFVKKNHPRWQVFGTYLTPHGDTPSRKEYASLDYETVCSTLKKVTDDQEKNLEPAVRLSIEQYIEMVKGNIVSDTDIAELSQQLYQKHQQAFDLVYQHRFAQRESIRKVLIGLIDHHPDLIYTHRGTNYPNVEYIHFASRNWDVPALQTGSSSQEANRSLLFGFGNYPNRVTLFLQIRPGDDTTRRKLLDMAHAHPKAFKNPQALLSKWTGIYSKTLLSPRLYERAVEADRKKEIYKKWNEFVADDLPRIDEALKKEGWIWQS